MSEHVTFNFYLGIQVRFTSSSYTVPENGGQVSLVVVSDGVNQESIAIPYMFTNGTAQGL